MLCWQAVQYCAVYVLYENCLWTGETRMLTGRRWSSMKVKCQRRAPEFISLTACRKKPEASLFIVFPAQFRWNQAHLWMAAVFPWKPLFIRVLSNEKLILKAWSSGCTLWLCLLARKTKSQQRRWFSSLWAAVSMVNTPTSTAAAAVSDGPGVHRTGRCRARCATAGLVLVFICILLELYTHTFIQHAALRHHLTVHTGRKHLAATFVIKDFLGSLSWRNSSVLLRAEEVNEAAQDVGQRARLDSTLTR